MNKNMRKGFTLAETLITLLIIAVLMTILMPIINKAKPDENELMHKKATFIVERVVNELVTDEFLYPKNAVYTGLGNMSPVTVNGKVHAGATKFCTLFASRINLAANTGVSCLNGQKSLTSAEGIDWYLPISTFQEAQTLKVDVNGSKGPNCEYSQNCKRPDQFLYQLKSGLKTNDTIVPDFGKTEAPTVRPVMPGEPAGPGKDQRPGQKFYCIFCNNTTNGTVLGHGCNKPNGHYQLVAIPKIGYKASWFTKSVTIKDANVPTSECDVIFTPLIDIPVSDKDIVNPVDPDEPVGPPKTYCIKGKINGVQDMCAIGGLGCEKPVGQYYVTASSKPGYTPSWTEQKVNIIDKDVEVALDCSKNDSCFKLTFSGDTTNCPVTPPAATCKTEKDRYLAGTYDYTVTPKEGYSFGEGDDVSVKATKKQAIVVDKDLDVPIKCNKVTAMPPVVNIYVKDTYTGVQGRPAGYYHTYKYYYSYKRTLSVSETEAKDLDVKMNITGKYSGKLETCNVYNYSGVCSTSPLTLKENDVDSYFSLPLSQELTKTSSPTWEGYAELGAGRNGPGADYLQIIKSNWEKYTLTINGKALLTNQSYPSGSSTIEVKDGTTTFKIHFEPAEAYLIRVNEINGTNGQLLAVNNGYIYTNIWLSPMSGGNGNLPNYHAHLIHKGDSIHLTAPNPIDISGSGYESVTYLLSGINFAGSSVCDVGNSSVDCFFTVGSASSYPTENLLTVSYRPKNPTGGGGGGTSKYATINVEMKNTSNTLGYNCTEGWTEYSAKSSDYQTVSVSVNGTGSICTYNSSNGQKIGCYGDASVNDTGSTVKYQSDYTCYPRGDDEYENLDWATPPTCFVNIAGRQVSCNSGSTITVNNTTYTVSKSTSGGTNPPAVQTYTLNAMFFPTGDNHYAAKLVKTDSKPLPEYVTVVFTVKGKYKSAANGAIYAFTDDISLSLPGYGGDDISNAKVTSNENDKITELTSMTVKSVTGSENKGKYTITTEVRDWR